MFTLLLLPFSLAGELVIDAKVPVEVRVGGQAVAQLFVPALARVPVPTGPTEVEVYRNGSPTVLPIDFPEVGEVWVIAGRTGLTTEVRAIPKPDANAPVTVEFRVAGAEGVMLQIEGKRHVIRDAAPLMLELGAGRHAMQVRSVDGTVIWATGHLDLTGESPVRVQLTDGRLPETSGPGVHWSSGGR